MSLSFPRTAIFILKTAGAFILTKNKSKSWSSSTKEKKSAYTYSDTLRTSRYTKDEFEKYGDGFGDENICDGFTFA